MSRTTSEAMASVKVKRDSFVYPNESHPASTQNSSIFKNMVPAVLLLCCVVPWVATIAPPAPLQYFVSPSGSATGAGTSPGTAVATLEQVKDVYRAARRKKGSPKDRVIVNVLPGVYGLTAALLLDSPLDSNVEWRGPFGVDPTSANELPLISGGVALPRSSFAFNSKLSAWEAPLPAGVVVDDAGAAAYLDGKWMPPLHTQPLKAEEQSKFYIVYQEGRTYASSIPSIRKVVLRVVNRNPPPCLGWPGMCRDQRLCPPTKP